MSPFYNSLFSFYAFHKVCISCIFELCMVPIWFGKDFYFSKFSCVISLMQVLSVAVYNHYKRIYFESLQKRLVHSLFVYLNPVALIDIVQLIVLPEHLEVNKIIL